MIPNGLTDLIVAVRRLLDGTNQIVVDKGGLSTRTTIYVEAKRR